MKSRHFSILYALISVLAILTTLATGFWARSINGKLEYGFPLPWKTVEIIPSPLPPTSYNWSFFILDAAFYAAIGYGIVLFYAWFVWKQQDHFNFASVSKQRIHPYLKKIGVPY